MDFPELAQLELEKLRKENLELKQKLQGYEAILAENDLLDAVPTISDAELICTQQIAKYRKAVDSGAVLDLNDVKILDLLVKNLMIARGKATPEVKEKKKPHDKLDIGKLLKLAEGNDE